MATNGKKKNDASTAAKKTDSTKVVSKSKKTDTETRGEVNILSKGTSAAKSNSGSSFISRWQSFIKRIKRQ